MATIKFDQVGLTPPGVAGKTRSDGLSNGALVTITTSEAGIVQFLWVPIDDSSAVSSLSQTSPTTWTFTPSSNVYGTYRVKFTATSNPAATTIRLFVIRTPNRHLRIPALNERASPNANLINLSDAIVAASEFNEPGEGDAPFSSGDYTGWWSALAELFMAVENLEVTGGTVEEISTEGTGLIITSANGPIVDMELDWGTTTGKVADGGVVAAISSTVSGHTSSISSISSTVGTHTTQIGTNTTNIATNTSNLSAHIANVANPHTVTKTQVGLANVTNDAQLKRADNDWAGYSAITAPTLSDKVLAEIAAGGVKGTLSLSALVTLVKAQLRDPVWDAPTTGTPDNDEFDVDSVQSGAWAITLSNAVALIRDGVVDPTVSVLTGHYRSSIVGSTLVLQLRTGDSVILNKTVAAALSTHQIWTLGIGMPTEMSTGSINNPTVSFGFYRNNAGFLDFNNRVFIRTGTSNERYEVVGQIAGSAVTVATNAHFLEMHDGLAMRIDHSSAAVANACGFSFRRNQSIGSVCPANSVQYNLSSDRVAIGLLSSPVNNPVSPNNALFSLHFMRRLPANNPGFLAQA